MMRIGRSYWSSRHTGLISAPSFSNSSEPSFLHVLLSPIASIPTPWCQSLKMHWSMLKSPRHLDSPWNPQILKPRCTNIMSWSMGKITGKVKRKHQGSGSKPQPQPSLGLLHVLDHLAPLPPILGLLHVLLDHLAPLPLPLPFLQTLVLSDLASCVLLRPNHKAESLELLSNVQDHCHII